MPAGDDHRADGGRTDFEPRVKRRRFVGLAATAGVGAGALLSGGTASATEVYPRTIAISGGEDNEIKYQFVVSGEIWGGGTHPEDIVLYENLAFGRVDGGSDEYKFDGEITAFDIAGDPVDVEVDGEERDVDDLVDEPDGTGTKPNTITIDGADDESVRYQFRVEEEAVKSTANDGTINPEDLIAQNVYHRSSDVSNDTVLGSVEGGTDSFEYDGALTAFDMTTDAAEEGTATVTINGEERDPEDLIDEPDGTGTLPNTITIRENAGENVRYQFSVADDLVHSTANGASIDPEDLIVQYHGYGGYRAYGELEGGTDSYEFAGDIGYFVIDDGDTEITVNGEAVSDPEGAPGDGSGADAEERPLEIRNGTVESGIVAYAIGATEFPRDGDDTERTEMKGPEDTVRGVLGPGDTADTFHVAADIGSVYATGDARVFWDGDRVPSGDVSDLPNTLQVVYDGDGTDREDVQWGVDVTGEIAPWKDFETDTIGEPAMEGTHADGVVSARDPLDAVRFAGTTTNIRRDPGAIVYLNGDRV